MPAAPRRRATAITPVLVATIIIAVLASVTTAVTVTIAVPAVITVVPATVIVTPARSTMSHVFSRSWCVRAVSYGVVNTNATAIQFNTVQFLNALRGLLNCAHFDETKAARAIRSLVIDDGHLFNATKAAKLIFKVAFLCPDAQSKYTEDIDGVGLQTMGRPTGRRFP